MPWYLVFGAAVAAVFGAARLLQVRGEARDRRRFQSSAEFVGLQHGRLHVVRRGSGRGPTIVIEQGAGGVAALWGPVQDSIAEFASVLAYDRLGLGWSDPAPSRRSVDDRVEDLRELLEAANVSGPYVFVAHSYGGLIVRRFARKYADRTAGLVLVDTVEEGIHFQADVLKLYSNFGKVLLAMALVQFLGLRRLWLSVLPNRSVLDDPRRASLQALFLTPRSYLGMRQDMDSLARIPATERAPWRERTFGEMPLAVVTHGQAFAGPFAMMEKYWSSGQRRLAALSTNGIFIVAQNSNHMIQDDQPQVVIEAIRQVYSAAATGDGLAQDGSSKAA